MTLPTMTVVKPNGGAVRVFGKMHPPRRHRAAELNTRLMILSIDLDLIVIARDPREAPHPLMRAALTPPPSFNVLRKLLSAEL